MHIRLIPSILLASALCVLGACGDDETAGQGPAGLDAFRDAPALDPAADPAEHWKSMMASGGKVRLTDDMMERYIALRSELEKADTPSEALLARYQFDAMEWATISQIIVGSMMRTGMSDARTEVEARLEAKRAERAAATDPQEQARLDMTIQALEAQRRAVAGFGEASEIDRHNREVLRRWEDRLKAARDGD